MGCVLYAFCAIILIKQTKGNPQGIKNKAVLKIYCKASTYGNVKGFIIKIMNLC